MIIIIIVIIIIIIIIIIIMSFWQVNTSTLISWLEHVSQIKMILNYILLGFIDVSISLSLQDVKPLPNQQSTIRSMGSVDVICHSVNCIPNVGVDTRCTLSIEQTDLKLVCVMEYLCDWSLNTGYL